MEYAAAMDGWVILNQFHIWLSLIYIKGTVPQKSMWALDAHFSKETAMVPYICVWETETHGSRGISARSWDYLVYLRDLAVHKDHLPHHRMS